MYALIALGYTMVYGIIELINFAHGDVFTLGSFLCIAILALIGVAQSDRIIGGWQGAGIALLKELARIAVARGCGRVEWLVLDWNEPAIQFYRKLGAVPMDEWTTFRLTGDPLAKLAVL